jgi:hypothetical protein
MTLRYKDLLEELDQVMQLRPGTSDSDVNVYAIEYPVTYGLLTRIRKEIEDLRTTIKWVNAGLPTYSYNPATDSFEPDQKKSDACHLPPYTPTVTPLEPSPEDEKDRLWNLVKSSVEGT